MKPKRSKSKAAQRERLQACGRPYGRVTEIFERKWRASVPMNATMSQAWIQTNGGRYASGSPYWDRLMDNQSVETYITISKMVDYMREGVNISLAHSTDTKLIYDVIQQYLLYAATVFTGMVDPSVYSDTLDDLRDLDRLAGIVYRHARFHEPELYTSNPFIQRLRGFNPWSNARMPARPERAILRERNELSSIFTRMIDPAKLPQPEVPVDPFANMEPLE